MRMEILNGTPIPYDMPTKELEKMMSSPVMKDFSLACEALSCKADPEAYEIMKSYINDKDKYRRLYILKTIFRHQKAEELTDFVINAISSDDILFVGSGLNAVAAHNLVVPHKLLLSTVKKHLDELFSGSLYALRTLEACEENYNELIKLLRKANQCAQKEILCEILLEGYLPDKAAELFELFGCDKFPKIRAQAVRLAAKYGYCLSKFLSDTDGHMRLLATKALNDRQSRGTL